MKALLIAAAAAVLPTAALASVITSGSVNLIGSGPGPADHETFSLNIDGANYSGGVDLVNEVVPTGPYLPGQTVPVGQTILGEDMYGTYTINGVTSNVFYGDAATHEGMLTIVGTPITFNNGPGIYAGAFDLTGSICVYNIPPPLPGPNAPCQNTGGAAQPVTASGAYAFTVADFVLPNGLTTYQVSSVVYTVPEPMPLSLLSAGALAMVFIGRRPRRRLGADAVQH